MTSHQRSYGTLTTVPPSRAIASSFVCGACRGDDRRRHAELAGGPGDALRHVAGARRDDSLGRRRVRRLPDRVDGAADLERADRLQVLELEPDLRRPVDGEANERRADRGAGDRLAGALDLGERDQNSTSVPTPCSRALRTISSAAARSSTARPSDLKTVSSSSSVAARMGAGQHLAELGADVLLAEPGQQQVARLVQGRLAPVDEEARRGHRLGVELAGRRQARADGVHVRARGQPSRCRIGSRALVQVQTTSAPRSTSSGVPPSPRLHVRISASSRTARIASACERAWTPAPRIATTARRAARAPASRPPRPRQCGSR